jgi:hypothetical protein
MTKEELFDTWSNETVRAIACDLYELIKSQKPKEMKFYVHESSRSGPRKVCVGYKDGTQPPVLFEGRTRSAERVRLKVRVGRDRIASLGLTRVEDDVQDAKGKESEKDYGLCYLDPSAIGNREIQERIKNWLSLAFL